MSNNIDFCLFQNFYPTSMEKFFFDTAAGAGVDAAKTALQKVIHKPFEVTE